MSNILVTGGAGFIGSNFVHYWRINHPDDKIVVLDKLTYAGNLDNLEGVLDEIKFVQGDICDEAKVWRTISDNKIDGIIHFAAESHVDNSIKNPSLFLRTNIFGTYNLLDNCREYWNGNQNKFIHISTDEVYGSLSDKEFFTEESQINPSSPYSASKASSDLIAQAYHKTYGMNINITNCSNNYGPRQHQEKLIPHIIDCVMRNKKFPVYGNGMNIRDWLYVDDHCKAIDLIFHNGKPGERYNIGGNNERRNIDIVKLILGYFDKSEDLIEFVEDRKGHDYRYAIDSTKLRNELGWRPETSFEDGIIKTINWYLKNKKFY